jgi:geranylgeranyl diphosphate synthase, type I
MTPDALLEQFDSELFEFLHRADPRSETFREMVAYHMAWRSWDNSEATANTGKRLRPLVTLLTAQTLAGDYRPAVPAAIAVQLVHDFSLILDDIMDHDQFRRNRPSLWVNYGASHAMTAAAGLYVLGLDALQDYRGVGAASFGPRDLSRILLDTCLEMNDAQHADLDWENRFSMTLDQVKEVALGRTCLIRCGAELGAASSVRDPAIQEVFREFGSLLAVAYTLFDDQLGLWGNEDRNGKPLRSDLREHKKTYPIVAGYLGSGLAGRRRLETLLARPEPDDDEITSIMELLDEADARGATLREGERLSRLAIECLQRPVLAGYDVSALIEMTESLLRGLISPSSSLPRGGPAW